MNQSQAKHAGRLIRRLSIVVMNIVLQSYVRIVAEQFATELLLNVKHKIYLPSLFEYFILPLKSVFIYLRIWWLIHVV